MHLYEINKNKIFSSIRSAFDRHPIIKFISVLLVMIFYFIFVAKSHGIENGFLMSILTWSFFVLCTPIADAGILIDFPMRVITGIKMMYSEVVVWIIAIGLNAFMLFSNSNIYDKTIILSLLKHIINTPFPCWAIIILSAMGTFLSIYIADNLIDTKKSKKEYSSFVMRHKIIIFICLILFIIVVYDFSLNKLGIQIPLF